MKKKEYPNKVKEESARKGTQRLLLVETVPIEKPHQLGGKGLVSIYAQQGGGGNKNRY